MVDYGEKENGLRKEGWSIGKQTINQLGHTKKKKKKAHVYHNSILFQLCRRSFSKGRIIIRFEYLKNSS